MAKPSIASPIWRSLMTGVFFALVTASSIFIAWKIGESSQISQALALIAGMTAMATLSAFNQFRQSALEADLNLTNNNKGEDEKLQLLDEQLQLLKNAIRDLAQPPKHDIRGSKFVGGVSRFPVAERTFIQQDKDRLPWNLSPENLIELDKSLALASLRLDLEEEIRRVAFISSIRDSESILEVAIELAKLSKLPQKSLEELSEVVRVCHQATHGEDVSEELARQTIATGQELLKTIRSASKIELTEVSEP